jgi:hypothetical protein
MSNDTPSPLSYVITIGDERIKSHLDRVVRGTVEETLKRAAGCGGGSAVQCAALRARRGRSRHAGWALRAQAADQGGRGAVEGTEASPADLRDRDHRVLSAA